MLTKHCLQEFKLDCQLRRLSDRTIKGYYNNTLNFLVYLGEYPMASLIATLIIVIVLAVEGLVWLISRKEGKRYVS